MPKPSYQELSAYFDPLQSDFYELIIPNIPGAPPGATEIIRLACQQVSLPAKLIEPVPVETAGNQLQYAGRSQYDHDVTTMMIENRNSDCHKALRNYLEFIRRHEDQTGHYKRDYAREGTLFVYDQMGKPVESFTLHGLWLSNLGEIQFDGSGSNLVMLNATWQIDYWEPADGFAGAGGSSFAQRRSFLG